MSYPYRVVVTRGVEEVVTACDKSERRVELPPILSPEASRDLLRGALVKRGWQGEGKTLTKTGADGTVQEIDLETGVVTTTLSGEQQIKKEVTLEGRGDSWKPPTSADEAALRKRVEEEAERRIAITDEERAGKKSGLETEVAAKLKAGDEERAKELNDALLEVYAESLKKKARGMGTVTEIREERSAETGDYELVIRIEA